MDSSGVETGDQASAKRKSGQEEDDNEVKPPIKRIRLARKECTICYNEVAVNQFPKLPHKTAKNHDRGVCRSCWEAHLVSEVSSKGWYAVSCPQCTEVLSEAELRKIASTKTYMK